MWLYLRQCLRFCTALQGSDICSFKVNSFYITELYFASCLCMNCLCFRYGEGDDENKTFHNIKELLLDCMGNPVRKCIIFSVHSIDRFLAFLFSTTVFVVFQNYLVDVVYLPVVFAPVTSELFMMSGYHDVFPLSAHEWLKTSSQVLAVTE